jgi:hypothetical protein
MRGRIDNIAVGVRRVVAAEAILGDLLPAFWTDDCWKIPV